MPASLRALDVGIRHPVSWHSPRLRDRGALGAVKRAKAVWLGRIVRHRHQFPWRMEVLTLALHIGSKKVSQKTLEQCQGNHRHLLSEASTYLHVRRGASVSRHDFHGKAQAIDIWILRQRDRGGASYPLRRPQRCKGVHQIVLPAAAWLLLKTGRDHTAKMFRK
jgi:hypothetical protein